MKLSELIISERTKRKLSQRGLAIKANLRNSTISRIEKDEVVPDTATLKKLAAALNIDIDILTAAVLDKPLSNSTTPVLSQEQEQAFKDEIAELRLHEYKELSEEDKEFLKSQFSALLDRLKKK